MKSPILALVLSFAALPGAFAAQPPAQPSRPQADFLLLGSYHMDNPGRDVFNTKADDVLLPKRQAEIRDVVERLKRYRPTRVFIEYPAEKQQKLEARFADVCSGKQPYSRGEEEQIGFRIACELKLGSPVAADWNDMGPIKDDASIDYTKAFDKYGQQQQRDRDMVLGKALNEEGQAILARGTVLDMLRHLNGTRWRALNAEAYYRIAQYGTPADPVGANWEALWYLRNRLIANNIVRGTRAGDRVLVIYGAGHGNWLVQNAAESRVYRVHALEEYLGKAR